MNAKLVPTALLMMCACLLTGCAKLPDDGANAQSKHYDNMNRVRCDAKRVGAKARQAASEVGDSSIRRIWVSSESSW